MKAFELILPKKNYFENILPIFPKVLQIITDIISQLELLSTMIKRPIPANRHIDHDIDELSSSRSMVTETPVDEKSNQKVFTCLQPETLTTYVISTPNINSSPPSEVTEISLPTGFTLIPFNKTSLL